MEKLDQHLLIVIAKHDRKIWRIFSLLNKYMNIIFNPLSYELQFRNITDYGNCIAYYLDGRLHRTNGPAVIYTNGAVQWYKNGKLHRDVYPAVIHANGVVEWYRNG